MSTSGQKRDSSTCESNKTGSFGLSDSTKQSGTAVVAAADRLIPDNLEHTYLVLLGGDSSTEASPNNSQMNTPTRSSQNTLKDSSMGTSVSGMDGIPNSGGVATSADEILCCEDLGIGAAGSSFCVGEGEAGAVGYVAQNGNVESSIEDYSKVGYQSAKVAHKPLGILPLGAAAPMEYENGTEV